MGIFDFCKKQKYKVDKTYISKDYVERAFHFLIDSGYEYEYYAKYSEREFIYKLKECRVEILFEDYVLDCVIQTTDFSRSTVTQTPLASDDFKAQFLKASNQERIDMIAKMLRENSDSFLLS